MEQLMQRIFLLLGAICVLAFVSFAQPMTFQEVSCVDYWHNGQTCILAQGNITPDTPDHLQRFLDLHPGLNSPFGPSVIYLDSVGGSVVGAVEMGRMIHARDWDTQVGGSYVFRGPHPQCLSACVWVFAGGRIRTYDASHGRLGIHQFYGVDDAGLVQQISAMIAVYLKDMNVNRALLDTASQISSDEMFTVTGELANQSNLDNSHAPLESWQIRIQKDGSFVTLVSQSQAQLGTDLSTAAVILHRKGENVNITLVYQMKSAPSQGSSGTATSSALIGMDAAAKARNLFTIPPTEWAPLLEGRWLTHFTVPVAVARELAQFQSLCVVMNNAPMAAFGTDGLADGMRAVLSKPAARAQ
jgi:hypothetical protein